MRTAFAGAENLFMRFNNSGSINISGHHLIGDGSGAGASGYANNNYSDLSPMSNANRTTGVFGSYIVDILDYSRTDKFKTIRCIGGFDNNGSGFADFCSSLIQTTSAITDIHQIGGTATNNFIAGTRVDLYGVATNPIATGA